jgi:hypothetical protein
MATEPLIELGSNYELDEDSNGNLVIRDANSNAVLKYDDANTRWELAQDIVPATDGAEQLGAASKAFSQLVSNAVGNDGSSLSVDDDLDLQGAQSVTNARSVRTESATLDGTIRYAGSDSELDTAVSESVDGDVIYLGNATFSDDRTLSKRLALIGTAGPFARGTTIEGAWTLNERIAIKRIPETRETITLSNRLCNLRDCGLSSTPSPTVQINANKCSVIGCNAGSVTFASGTTDGLVDACSNGTTVTDNGSNTVGDLG